MEFIRGTLPMLGGPFFYAAEVAQVRPRSRPGGGLQRGFTYPEMVFLLLVVALFLAGTVWVVNSAIAKSHPLGKSDTAGRDTETALDRIQALVRTARVFAGPRPTFRAGSWMLEQAALTFCGDLDGDPKTGSYVAAGQGGLEKIMVFCRGDLVLAEVYEAPGSTPRRVVLLTDLSPRDPKAFLSSFKVEEPHASCSFGVAGGAMTREEGFTVSEMQVSVTTGPGQSRLVLGRSIGLPQRPVVIAAPGLL